MFSPSDYNDAVPQFTNGNYANTPLNPLYVEEPDAANYNRGAEPLQTLPAQWWNWLCNKITAKLNKLNIYVKNIFDELAQLLSLVSVTPDATEETPTIGQLKDMFGTKYPQYLYDNFKFESLLQGRTRGVMVAPTDSWTDGTNTLSLTGGFGIIDTYHKVTFADCDLILPNDDNVHYIVSDTDGIISIEDSIGDNVILVGLCHDKEYCLLIDNNPDQCKDNIILKKWFGQNKITQDFVSILQNYYNVSTSSIKTNIVVVEANELFGAIKNGVYNNCTITVDTVNDAIGILAISGVGITNGEFNNCIIHFNSVKGTGSIISGGVFNNCSISIELIGVDEKLDSSYGISGGVFNNCSVIINTICYGSAFNGTSILNFCLITIETINYTGSSGWAINAYGLSKCTCNTCVVNINTVTRGTGVSNNSNVTLNNTNIKCTDLSNLNKTSGKLNILNDTVLHAS